MTLTGLRIRPRLFMVDRSGGECVVCDSTMGGLAEELTLLGEEGELGAGGRPLDDGEVDSGRAE